MQKGEVRSTQLLTTFGPGANPGEHDHAPLNGAACHGCLLVPETSCEQRNEFLDRALVVSTVENVGAEFFSLP